MAGAAGARAWRRGVEKEISAEVPVKSRWRWVGYALSILAALAVVGLIAFFGQRQAAEKIETIKPVKFIGHSDEAAYALMGKSLSEGRGIYVNYVSMFFIQYSPSITRREDHWPPFMGAAIAVFFHFMGVQVWVARLPAILFASVGLPLMTALLVYALCRRGYAALVAGLVIMANASIYTQSLRTLSDGATALLVAGFCASVVLAAKRPWFHVLAGVFAACAYYAKGSELFLLALYPLLAALACGMGVFKRRRFYLGIVVSVLMLAPFWYANYRDFGNPLHSTQNYVSGFYGLEDWESAAYFPYWNQNLPKTSDRWEKHPDDYWPMCRAQVARAVQYVLTGTEPTQGDVWGDFGSYGIRARDFITGEPHSFAARLFRAPVVERPVQPIGSWQQPVWELAGVCAVGLLAAAVVSLPVIWVLAIVRGIRRFLRRKQAPAATAVNAVRRRSFIGPTLAVWTVLIAQILFISFFWEVNERFCFPMLPLALALGCAGAARFIEWPAAAVVTGMTWIVQSIRRGKALPAWARRTDAGVRQWPAVATLVVVAMAWSNREAIYAAQTNELDRAHVRAVYPWPQDDRYVTTGEWIAKNLPNAVVMCRNPWELVFYMGPNNKGVCFPNPSDNMQKSGEQILAIARYYGVTHILADEVRPSLEPYLLRPNRGMKKVKGAPDALFEIDWKMIPMKTVEQAMGRVAMPAAVTAAATRP